MNNELNYKQLNSLVDFQRNCRYLLNTIKSDNNKLEELKNLILKITYHLKYLNDSKLTPNSESFNIILNEIYSINSKINLLPPKIKIKNYSKNISLSLFEIKDILINLLNHISTDNIFDNIQFLTGENWEEEFNNEEINDLSFYNNYFIPFCVWDSNYHKSVVNYKEPEEKSKTIIDELIEESKSKKSTSSIIIGDGSLPMFLKTLTEFAVNEKQKKTHQKRKNHYNFIDVIDKINSNKIYFEKNTNSLSLLEDRKGGALYIKVNKKILIFQGIFRDDLLNISKNYNLINNNISRIKNIILYNCVNINKQFKFNYLNTLNLQQIIILNKKEIISDIETKYIELVGFSKKEIVNFINEFLLASKFRKIEILSLLLMGNNHEKKIGYIIYEIFKSKDKKNIHKEIYDSLHYKLKEFLKEGEAINKIEEEELTKLNDSDLPYEKKINLMLPNMNIKMKAMDKLKSINNNFQGDGKAQSWLDGLLKIPFETFKENKIMNFKMNFLKKIKEDYQSSDTTISNKLLELGDQSLIEEWMIHKDEKKTYLENVKKCLNNSVYGHEEAKLQIERLFAQWINGEVKGAVLGLYGPPGTGKTSLAKNGLSKCLIEDDGSSRPFAFLPLGGSVNGSTLVGHNYTYVGSTWGRIVDILINSKCMNPIIYIDELDKVSNTEHGREIISILTHLTDSTQNDTFEDKYFSGVPLDLSKALIVFSFNDLDRIDHVLRDRITIIETKPLILSEKLKILKDYTLPDIYKEVGLSKSDIIISDDIIKYIIETYTNEAGVRKIKEKMVDIVRDLNLNSLYEKINLPYTVTEEYVKKLFEDKPKMKPKKIAKEPSVGLVNGLYATTTGVGGLTIIQVMKYPSEKMLELSLTGKQGDVMKESVNYALRIAYNLLTEEQQNKIISDSNDKKNFGLHVHTPEAATPKDGPSAGAAMTLAIYSVLTGKKINNRVALTGEIDLCKNVTAIGGVFAKLTGAKQAGVNLALIPKENSDDLEKMRRLGISPEDDKFKVEYIETIEDVIKHAL